MAVERTFQDIDDENLTKATDRSFLRGIGWSKGATWEQLLLSRRILIISEAGAGKTTECRRQADRLMEQGEPAFFVELTTLAEEGLRESLDHDERRRLDQWIASQSETATFFLDSVDELNLTRKKFAHALKKFSDGIDRQLGRCRVVITSRPTPFDLEAVRKHLFIPEERADEDPEEEFVRLAMGEKPRDPPDGNTKPAWRTVALLPLSDDQIMQYAEEAGLADARAFLEDLRIRDALEFARRPLDLNELCTSWRLNRRFGTHKKQVHADIQFKLRPREDRDEPAELTMERATEGAARLALALVLTRRLTIRYGAESDAGGEDAALDPASILEDFSLPERKALLERPLFGYASYGRVRFHHRSVIDYLAALRLRTLHARGVIRFAVLRDRIFCRIQDKLIVRPSMRSVAGWLALDVDEMFRLLRDHEPAVLLDHGDPRSLPLRHREQALEAYVERYGKGGWRGLTVPNVQLHRFGDPQLAATIVRLWGAGIENPDVREMLLQLIWASRISECANLLAEVAANADISSSERLLAIEGLSRVRDSRLAKIVESVAAGEKGWTDRLSVNIATRLFPQHMQPSQLCSVLARLKRDKRNSDSLNWTLPRLIAHSMFDPAELRDLRDGLVALVGKGLKWQDGWPHIVSDNAHLSNALAATCARCPDALLDTGWADAWALSLVLEYKHADTGPRKELQARASGFGGDAFSLLFWAVNRLLRRLKPPEARRFRLNHLIHMTCLRLSAERDLVWIERDLADTARDQQERDMLLSAALWLPTHCDVVERAAQLRPLVSDSVALLTRLEQIAVEPEKETQEDLYERERALREQEQAKREEEFRARWREFRRRVLANPDEVFAESASDGTAWSLAMVMGQDEETQRWNRQFVERHFNKDIADRLRLALMRFWRKQHVMLPSERPRDERNDYSRAWTLGVSGIYAEAEDPNWAKSLSEPQVELASRLAPFEFNGLPKWLGDLVDVSPRAVDRTLGAELSWELREPASETSFRLLQDIRYAPRQIAGTFVPRILAWLDDEAAVFEDAASDRNAHRLDLAVSTVMDHGNAADRETLCGIATRRLHIDLPLPSTTVWLSVLLRLRPEAGVAFLESRLEQVPPGKYSTAVKLFGSLFGNRQDSVAPSDRLFTPQLLLRLVRLAYRHVRTEYDWEHESTYSPDERDEAERSREALLRALLDSKGDAAWDAKITLAKDPLSTHFKDRIMAFAEEVRAVEADSAPFDERQVVELDSKGEASPKTNEAMFLVMTDRIEAIKDSLLQDDTIRDLLEPIRDEHKMRRQIARLFRQHANDMYRVSQEGVTADEKETDIRLSSLWSDHEAVVELKIGDNNWSAKVLRETIREQLVEKYMAPENRRSGCLMITVHGSKKWQHPDTKIALDVKGLQELLDAEARKVEKNMGSGVRLSIAIIDLRPRLGPENAG